MNSLETNQINDTAAVAEDDPIMVQMIERAYCPMGAAAIEGARLQAGVDPQRVKLYDLGHLILSSREQELLTAAKARVLATV